MEIERYEAAKKRPGVEPLGRGSDADDDNGYSGDAITDFNARVVEKMKAGADRRTAIKASRYRDLMPRAGAGSRGGNVEAIKFRNGATLKFMSAGGGDAGRSAFTARVAILTELDKFDEAGGASRETDKVSQIIAKTDRFGSRRRIYGECTVRSRGAGSGRNI